MIYHKLRSFLFFQIDSRQLSFFRVLFCLALTTTVYYYWTGSMGVLIEHSPRFSPVPAFEFLGIGRPTPFQLNIIAVTAMISLTATALVSRSKLWVLLSLIMVFLFFGTHHSLHKSPFSDYTYHNMNGIIYALLILLMAPGSTQFLLRDLFRERSSAGKLTAPRWPVFLIHFTISAVYFGAALTRFRHSGFLWADGRTLQASLLNQHLLTGLPQALWLANQYWICVVFSIMTYTIEFGFFMILFLPRIKIIMIISALLMHVCMWYFMSINFLNGFCFLFLSFIPFSILAKRVTAGPS